MILKDYIRKNKLSIKDFAISMGVTPGTLYKIRTGERRVTVGLAIKIERETHGDVSREEALWPQDFVEKNEDGSEQACFTIRRCAR